MLNCPEKEYDRLVILFKNLNYCLNSYQQKFSTNQWCPGLAHSELIIRDSVIDAKVGEHPVLVMYVKAVDFAKGPCERNLHIRVI